MLAAALVALAVAAPASAHAQEAGSDGADGSAANELARRYAPLVMVKQQAAPCDTDGEPFEPAPVDIVLDNPEIFLRQVGNDDPVAMRGPSGADIFDLRAGWYLDFPGDALDPGCIFEQDFHRFYDGRSTVYAHVATQADRPGHLALQYWFFWYHTPAKNDHEGDWEFIQLLFEAGTVEEALAGSPVGIGYAQHTGGERADWTDPKVERDGDHPIVHAAKGSHAAYFGAGLYLLRSGNEGFGCDDTTGPSRRLTPEVVLLPDEVTDPNDPFAWLSFQGRWGQREPGFFNGPTGPFAKERWDTPVTWYENQRTSSVVIPGGDRFGDDVVSTFCRSVEIGSSALTRTLRSPVVAIVVLAVLIVAIALLVRLTRWSPVEVEPVRAPRAAGQILRTAWRLWPRAPGAALAVGLVYAPVAIVAAGIQAGVLALPFVDQLVELAGERSWVAFSVAIVVGGFADLLAFVYISASVARILDRPADDTDRRTFPTWAEVGHLARAVGRATVVVVGLTLSIVGIPWAIRRLVDYQLAPQAVVIEGHGGRASLDRSRRLVRGRWWWTAGLVLGVELAIAAVGFAVAIVVLLAVRTLPLWAFNLVGSAIFVVLVPVGAAAVSYVYGTLASRAHRPAPAPGDDVAVEAAWTT